MQISLQIHVFGVFCFVLAPCWCLTRLRLFQNSCISKPLAWIMKSVQHVSKDREKYSFDSQALDEKKGVKSALDHKMRSETRSRIPDTSALVFPMGTARIGQSMYHTEHQHWAAIAFATWATIRLPFWIFEICSGYCQGSKWGGIFLINSKLINGCRHQPSKRRMAQCY